jgi:hypothetical protein
MHHLMLISVGRHTKCMKSLVTRLRRRGRALTGGAAAREVHNTPAALPGFM